MARRATFMYGRALARGPRGHVDSGLGKSPAFGSIGILAPTETVGTTPHRATIDGVEFVFQFTPQSEAPAEFTFYLPAWRAFCGAELTSRTLHNLYTLRGAKVRDALRWSGFIEESVTLFGDAEIYFASHHWPLWGNAQIVEFLQQQADTYKYIHDQSVRMFNDGMTPAEIAAAIELPRSLRRGFHNRGYYGTLRHNARAVYQAYLGWYDGNPANLDPLPPADAGARYVALMGGADGVLDAAGQAFEAGEYRWAAQLLDHLVFAEPGNAEARALLARTYDQLGYQAESGPWRDVYLSGAYELRHGRPETGIEISLMADLLAHTPIPHFFDSLAVRLDAAAAEGRDTSVEVSFTDRGERYLLTLRNAVLRHRPVREGDEPDATLALTHELFVAMLTGRAGIRDTLFSDDLDVDGSVIELVRFFALFEKPDSTFAIVTP